MNGPLKKARQFSHEMLHVPKFVKLRVSRETLIPAIVSYQLATLQIATANNCRTKGGGCMGLRMEWSSAMPLSRRASRK